MATPTTNPPTVWASALPYSPEKAVVKILTVISQAIAPLCLREAGLVLPAMANPYLALALHCCYLPTRYCYVSAH